MLGKFKRFLSLLCAIVIVVGTYGAYLIPIQSIVNAAENEILDLDDDVKYFGRTFYEYDNIGNKVYKFSWANSGFQFSFKGKGATVTLQGYRHEADGNTAEYEGRTPYVKVYINGELATSHNISGVTVTNDGRIKIEPGQDREITLTNLKEGNYTVKVVKCTDGYYNGISLHKIQLLDVDDIVGEILETQKYYDRQMLIIGDTLVSGYATLATTSEGSDTTAYEDSTLSFAAIAADAFGAENMTVALRNRGIVTNSTNSDSSTKHLAKDYFEYLDFFEDFNKRSEQYDHTQYNPDVVVINLGFHDAAKGTTAATFEPECKDFIMQVKTTYPDAKILFTYGFTNSTANVSTIASAIENVIKELNLNGYDDIFYIPLSALEAEEQGYKISSSYYAPTKEAHEARAKELILAIEDVTDWKSSLSESVPVTDDMPSDTLYRPLEDTDLSIMSFNVMYTNVTSNNEMQVYLEPSKRAPLIVKMFKSYMPDVLCVQEAGMKDKTLIIDDKNYSFGEYLIEQLTAAGYDYYTVKNAAEHSGNSAVANMDIASGLIIFWKNDRFDLQTEPGSNVHADVGKYTAAGRYWMWVRLEDKQNGGRFFYVYNTHVYNQPSDPDNKAHQDAMIDAISATTGSMSGRVNAGQPVFFAGDFVQQFNDAEDTLESKMIANGSKDAAREAPYTRQNDPNKTPNHIFFNSYTFDIREFHELYEGVEGRKLGSQEAIIAHFNYKGNVTFTKDNLNDDKSVFTDESGSGSYSLGLSVPSNTRVDIYNDAGTRVYADKTGILSLQLTLENKKVSHFTVRVKNYRSPNLEPELYDVINIYITRTDKSNDYPTVSASNTVNSYFANGAWHFLASATMTTVSATGGTLYHNPYATKPVTYPTLNLKQGRTVLYVKSDTTGDVYPVYIYRQTHVQSLDTSVLYADDDFPSGLPNQNNFKVAFYDGERVIFVDSSRACSTVEAVVSEANEYSDCSTIYFGSGEYTLNQEYNGSPLKFTEDVILLGSNYDISAVEEHSDRWYAAGRRPETVINGGFYFEKSGADISVTVKGFKFQGQTGYGALRFEDTANTVNSSTQTLDIQNNTFMCSVDLASTDSVDKTVYSGRGIIVAESQAKVTGIIKNNYFRCVQDNHVKSDKKAFTEALCLFNLQNMLIERNLFIGYQTALDICDVKDGQSSTTSTSYSVYSNRFEHCGSNKNYLFGVAEKDTVYIAYRNNDFVRCGSGSDDTRGESFKYAIDMFFDDSTKGNLPGKYFENITLDIIGNRFMDCSRSLRIRRTQVKNSTIVHYDVNDMEVNFNKNSIVNPLEYRPGTGYFHSVWFTSFANGDMQSLPTSNDVNDKWDLSGNYCYSPIYDENSEYFQSNFTDTISTGENNHDDVDIYDETEILSNYGKHDLRLYLMNYCEKMENKKASMNFTDSNFTPKIRAYDRVVKAFDGAVGSFEDGWKYDFDHIELPDTYDNSIEIGFEYDSISDIADMDFLRGTTPLSDKMTALDAPVNGKETKKIANHSMLTTEHLTGEMRGLTSFYSDVRWYCRNRVSFDIRTTYENDEATFFYKYSNGALDGKAISNELFYNESKTDTDGITLNFKTVNGKPTIEMRIYRKDGTSEPFVFTSDSYNITDMTEFNHIDIIEKEIGTMDFYVNGKRFAQVVGEKDDSYTFTSGSLASETNTSDNAYYTSLQVSRVTQDALGNDIVHDAVTVSNTSVTKQSAIAFSSADASADSTANELWPQKKSMEIDVLEVVDLGVGKITIINHLDPGGDNILYRAWNMTDCVYDEETKTYTYTINKDWLEFFNIEKKEFNEISLWVQGAWQQNGIQLNNWSDHIRTQAYIPDEVKEISIEDGYVYYILCCDINGNGIGYFDVEQNKISKNDFNNIPCTTKTVNLDDIREIVGADTRFLIGMKRESDSSESLSVEESVNISFSGLYSITQKIDVNSTDLWENGTIGGDGSEGKQDNRIKTQGYITTDIEEISVVKGYEYIIAYYDSTGKFIGYYDVNTGAPSGATGQWTSKTADIEKIREELGADKGIRLILRKIDDTAITVSAAENLAFIRSIPLEPTEDVNSADLWESGTIGGSGQEVANSYRIRTNDYISSEITKISVATGYSYIIACYDSNGNFGGFYNFETSSVGDGGYTSNTTDLEDIRKNVGDYTYFRLAARKTADNALISVSEAENLSLTKSMSQIVETDANNSSDLWERGGIYGGGQNQNDSATAFENRFRTIDYIPNNVVRIELKDPQTYKYYMICYANHGGGAYYIPSLGIASQTVPDGHSVLTSNPIDLNEVRKNVDLYTNFRIVIGRIDNAPLYESDTDCIRFITSDVEKHEDAVSKLFRTTVLDDGRILLTYDRGGENNPVEHDNEDMIQIAKAAVEYAQRKGLEPVGADKAEAISPIDPEKPKELYKAEIPIDGPGYYVVSSTLGSLITTDTFDNKDGTYNLTVYEKNDPPSVEKYVFEDSKGTWLRANDTGFNEAVEFKLVVEVQDGAYAYKVEDTYGIYLDKPENIVVKEFSEGYLVDADNSAALVREYELGTDYTLDFDEEKGIMTIKFASSDAEENSVGSLEDVPTGNKIEITYKSNVKETVFGANSVDLWENGVIDGGSGIVSYNNATYHNLRLVTKDYIPSNVKEISIEEGYSYLISCYNSEGKTNGRGAYYNPKATNFNDAFTTAGGSAYTSETIDLEEVRKNVGEYSNLKLMIKKNTEAAISPSDAVNVSLLQDENSLPIQTEAKLYYGRTDEDPKLDESLWVTEQFYTNPELTNTYLWDLKLYKFDKDTQERLTGAEFALCTDEAGTNKLKFVGSNGSYRLAADDEEGATTVLKADSNGEYYIQGLDGGCDGGLETGVYYLLETKYPAGYAGLTTTTAVRIKTTYANDTVTRENTYTHDIDEIDGYDAFGIPNAAGFLLPSTGAMGTKLFIATGSALILSMGILLVTRMRSSKVIFIKTETNFKVR